MFIVNEDNGPLTRAIILFHDFEKGEISKGNEPETLYRTDWCKSERKAQREALFRYWPLYEFKHGFKHPEDPRRTPDEDVPEGTAVMTMRPE